MITKARTSINMLKIGIFHFYALVIIACYSTAEPRKKLQPRIINGYKCTTSQVPYFVIIITDNNYCGGFLITYEWVLTAGHCMFKKSFGVNTKIHSAYDMPSQLRQVRNAKEFHIHPKLVKEDLLDNRDFRYDIGLVSVDRPFDQTVATRVATLPAPGFAKQCKRALIVGIGQTYNKEDVKTPFTQRQLNCANSNIMDTNKCKVDYAWGHLRPILFDDTIMCLYKLGTGVCLGDSGGPVICDDVVIGLNSVTDKNCETPRVGSTFMMIESHLDFIDNIVKFTGVNAKHV